MKSKGISVLVSAVIIVALTVTIGLLVSSFMSTTTQKNAKLPPTHYFGGVIATEEVMCEPTKISFIAKNIGTINVTGLKIFVKTTSGLAAYAENPNITLSPGSVKYVSVYLSQPAEGEIKNLMICSINPPNYCDEKDETYHINCGELSSSLGIGVEVEPNIWFETTQANVSYKFYQTAYMDEANITDYCVNIGTYPFCINATGTTDAWANITIYKVTDTYKKWVEEASSGVTTVHRIGGNPPSDTLTIRKDGNVWQTVPSDSEGYVEFTYNGPYPVVFEVMK